MVTKSVYTITERDGKSYWHKIGTAKVNQDGSLNIVLDALPCNGTLQVRNDVPAEKPKGR